MGLSRPKSVDSQGAERGGGGGGGSTNPYRDWTTIDIHDSSLWQRQDPATGPAQLGTITSGSGVTVYSLDTTGAKHIQPGTIKGTFYIAKAHLKPYEECGLAEPSGVTSNQIYPEQFSIKVELELDDIPITGPTGSESSFQYGQYGQVAVGLVHYASDQSSAPAMPDASSGFALARVYKNGNNNPETNDTAAEFKSGYMTGNAQGSTTGARWRCQPTGGDTRHNALIFQATFGPASRNSSENLWIQGGSYSTDNPRARTLMSGNGTQGTATRFGGASDRYVHIALAFCAFNNTSGSIFSCRVKRVRYLIQPISNREAFTSE